MAHRVLGDHHVQPLTEQLVREPQPLGRDRVDPLPVRVAAAELPPHGAHELPKQVGDGGRDPGRVVHAVGDRPDRHPGRRPLRPGRLPDLARYLAVQHGDPDRTPSHAEADVGRAEWLLAVSGPLPSQVEESVEVDPDLGQVGPEQALHQPRVEVVAAGGDRGVGGEDEGGTGQRQSALQVQAQLLSVVAHAFDRDQEAVSFVHMQRGRVHAQRPQRAHSPTPSTISWRRRRSGSGT